MADADAGYVPAGATMAGTPPVNVTALYQPTPAYVVLGLTQSDRRRPRDGKIIPTLIVSFRVPGLPGTHTIQIDNYAFLHADVLAYMRERSYLLWSLYALPTVLPPYSEVAPDDVGVIADLNAAAEADAAGELAGV
jgi:hypothetical protein